MNWGAVYASLMAEFHYTPRQIDEEMTLPLLHEIDLYWSQYPPIHMLIPAYMGYEPKKSVKPGEVSGDLEALAGLFGETVGVSVERQSAHGA